MSKTRESSHQIHLNWLMRLAITMLTTYYDLTPAHLREAHDRMTGSLALARQIADRYKGDHTAWTQIRDNVVGALAQMGRITAVEPDFTLVETYFVEARELCRSYLVSLTHEQRVQLATWDRFENAHLVEESHEEGRDPALVIVLNPVYAPETPAKKRVQDKANERFAERYGELAVINAIFAA
ncbi:hypothetical protein [Nonomuraea basaltis]|uniref:hypothetical protein n=1 Tax=Nonomuraea basaltis TaxID=2495887 RepID=UPI00110C5274|nr:hypothetical protein [Nonomuraea basaltis]TMR92554.1 hypothetical protein EJK15_43920 [Nonomuraea basaltis]